MSWWQWQPPHEHQTGYDWWRNAVLTGTQPVCPDALHDSVRWVCQQLDSQRVPVPTTDSLHITQYRKFVQGARLGRVDIIKAVFATGWLMPELHWYHYCYYYDYIQESMLDLISRNQAPLAVALAMANGHVTWLQRHRELVAMVPQYRRCYSSGTMQSQLAILQQFPTPLTAVGNILNDMAADTITPIDALGTDIWELMVASLWRTANTVTQWSDFQLKHCTRPDIADFLQHMKRGYIGDSKLLQYICGNTGWTSDDIIGFRLIDTWFDITPFHLDICIWQYGALNTQKRQHIADIIITTRRWEMIVLAIAYSKWRGAGSLLKAIHAAIADGHGTLIKRALDVAPWELSTTYRKVATLLDVVMPAIQYTEPATRTKTISVGGYGEVLKGIDEYGGAFAIKDQRDAQNAIIEVMVMRTVAESGAPVYICPIKHVYIDRSQVNSVMPYYQRNLDGYQCADETEWLTLGYRLLMGLDQLHSKGIAHGDFKSANIIMNTVADAVITDLGGARLIIRGVSNEILTTYPYEAPESNSNSFDMAVDIWAWGIIMLHACMGTRPVYHENYYKTYNLIQLGLMDNQTGKVIPNFMTKLTALPQWRRCVPIIQRALNINADTRPTARELLHDELFHSMHDQHTPALLTRTTDSYEYYRPVIASYWRDRVVVRYDIPKTVTDVAAKIRSYKLSAAARDMVIQMLYTWCQYCSDHGVTVTTRQVWLMVSAISILLGVKDYAYIRVADAPDIAVPLLHTVLLAPALYYRTISSS